MASFEPLTKKSASQPAHGLRPAQAQGLGTVAQSALLVQRMATTSATAEASNDDATEASDRSAARWVVEDSEDPGAGQIGKSEFLAELELEVCAAINQELVAAGREAADCEYLHYWFAFYSGRSGAQLEAAALRYAPAARSAQSVRELMDAIVGRARQAAADWVRTGAAAGLPDAGSLPPATSPESTGAATTAEQGALQYKREAGVAGAPASPHRVQAELGAGRPLPSGLQSRFELASNIPLGNVRVHDDAIGARVSERLSARAFTVGEHVAFAQGEYQPGTPHGDALLAHELAHVAQQRSGATSETHSATDDSLEASADRSAFATLAALWGGAQNALATPARATGLRIQRCCDRASTGPIGTARLATARTNFRNHNSSLGNDALNKIDAGLAASRVDDINLMISFFDYYTTHNVETMSSSDPRRARHLLAETSPNSDTELNPDVLATSYPNERLGALLIHEYTHTRHDTNVMGLGDYQEGDSYAIEYFYALRGGDTARAGTIIDLVTVNTGSIAMATLWPALRARFYETYHTMKCLYEIIDSGASTHAGSPFTSLTADDARELVAELVDTNASSRSTRLAALVTWANTNSASLTFP